jgi:hypothetical protein
MAFRLRGQQAISFGILLRTLVNYRPWPRGVKTALCLSLTGGIFRQVRGHQDRREE